MRGVGRLRKLLEVKWHKLTLPIEPWHNDFYIVEFPKSGITWVVTILANLALVSSGRKERASLSAVRSIVPDIHLTRDLGPTVYSRPPVRFIKSHARHNPYYNFMIYLVRHPVDVLKSYYRFNNEIGGRAFDSFDEFCRSKRVGAPAWKRHVRSWLEGRASHQKLHLCRYEDLLSDTYKEIASINENFGWALEEEQIVEAIERSTMNRMKMDEGLRRTRNPRNTMTFIGGSNDFLIEERTIAYINACCQEEYEMLGYDTAPMR